MQTNPLAKLQNKISTHFNIEELKNLCFELNIEYDNLPATILDGKCRELVKYCSRHNKLIDLIERLKELRVFVEWDIFEIDSFESKKAPKLIPQKLVPFSFLRQWEPMGFSYAFINQY